MYKLFIRPFLFLFDPEKIHYVTFSLIRFLCKIPFVPKIFRGLYQIEDKRLERTLFGITFKNPVGLAAGFDKNAVLYNELSNFGFGFIEIGTITPIGQEGNPKLGLLWCTRPELDKHSIKYAAWLAMGSPIGIPIGSPIGNMQL